MTLWRHILLLLCLKKLEDIRPFCGATDTPVLDKQKKQQIPGYFAEFPQEPILKFHCV